MIHDYYHCSKYNEPVLPDEDGACSLCGAILSEYAPRVMIGGQLLSEEEAREWALNIPF